MDFEMQDKVYRALERDQWLTIGEVAQRLSQRPNSTIRCILDTLSYAGLVLRSWGKINGQYAYFYKLPNEGNS
jgi:predicted transcriptional regulator